MSKVVQLSRAEFFPQQTNIMLLMQIMVYFLLLNFKIALKARPELSEQFMRTDTKSSQQN